MQKWPSRHHRTTLSCNVFATNARIDNRKKIVKQQYLLNMFPQYGELRPTIADKIGFGVWGTPANFNGFRVLAALLHGTLVVDSAKLCGVEQRAPPTVHSAGRPSRWTLVHILVMVALWNRAANNIFALWFLLSSSSSSFFPRLISAVADWMSTILPHMVWP